MHMSKENIIALTVGVALIFGVVYYVNAPKNTDTGTNAKVDDSNSLFINMKPQEFQDKIKELQDSGKDYVLLDVRTQEEFDSGFIAGAENLDFYKGEAFTQALSNMDKNKPYLIYCRSGARSGRTIQIMKDLGFKEVYNLSGGILDWNAQGLPLTKP